MAHRRLCLLEMDSNHLRLWRPISHEFQVGQSRPVQLFSLVLGTEKPDFGWSSKSKRYSLGVLFPRHLRLPVIRATLGATHDINTLQALSTVQSFLIACTLLYSSNIALLNKSQKSCVLCFNLAARQCLHRATRKMHKRVVLKSFVDGTSFELVYQGA